MLHRIVLTIAAVTVLSVALYLLAPGPVSSKSLGYSVADEAGAATLTACRDPRCERLSERRG